MCTSIKYRITYWFQKHLTAMQCNRKIECFQFIQYKNTPQDGEWLHVHLKMIISVKKKANVSSYFLTRYAW